MYYVGREVMNRDDIRKYLDRPRIPADTLGTIERVEYVQTPYDLMARCLVRFNIGYSRWVDGSSLTLLGADLTIIDNRAAERTL
jgi:hypothetical protein